MKAKKDYNGEYLGMRGILNNISFKRISSNKIIQELDGLRFVAILSVFLLHLRGIWLSKTENSYDLTLFDWILDSSIQLGGSGVQLFFVISGFILALPWMKKYENHQPAPKLSNFYFKRLTRLEPPYIISSLMFFLMLIIMERQNLQSLFEHLMATLLYVHNWIYGYSSPINKAAWSLEIEIQFYLLVPFLIPVLHRL